MTAQRGSFCSLIFEENIGFLSKNAGVTNLAEILSDYNGALTYTSAGAWAGGPGHVFKNQSTYLMTIKNNGNVGIGTTIPTAKLDVAGDIVANDVLVDGVSVATLSETAVLQGQIDALEDIINDLAAGPEED